MMLGRKDSPRRCSMLKRYFFDAPLVGAVVHERQDVRARFKPTPPIGTPLGQS